MDLMAQLNAITDLDWFEIQGYEAKELRDFILEKDAEIERLRNALSFYAKWGVVSPWVDAEIQEDGGDNARSALQQKESE